MDTPVTRIRLSIIPVLIALLMNLVVGPLAPVVTGLGNTARAAASVILEDGIEGCMGVRTTPGSENTTKELVGGSLEPGGTARFRFTFPAEVSGNPGQEEWKLTDCVFLDGSPIQKYTVTALENDISPVIIEFDLTIPADAPIGSEYCNYAKTTETPSDPQASNRKAGPACFIIGGALRVLKTNPGGEPLAGATFTVSCDWPDVSQGTFLPDTILSVPSNGTISGAAGSSETINSTDDGSFSRTVVTGDEGVISVNGPDATQCTFTETAAPAGYVAPVAPDNTVTLTIDAGGAQAMHTFINTLPFGNLEVVKALSPANDPGLFNLQIDGVTDPNAANVGNGGSTGQETVSAGNHTVGETAGTGTSLSNYTSSIACRADNGSGAVVASSSNTGPLTVNVTNGSDIVCTISNTRQTGKLEVVKDLSPSNDPGKFNLQIDGSTAGTGANVGDNGTTGEVTLNTGTHTVGETAGTATSLADYASSILCKADNGAGAIVASASGTGPLNVNVTNGSDIVCTISNTRDTGMLEVVKDLNPANDPGKFDLQINGATRADDVGDGGTTGAVTLNTGTHTVGEIAGLNTSLLNYTSSIECRAGNGAGSVVATSSGTGPLNVTIGDGDDIVCVITNTRQTGKIEVIKDLNPASDAGRFNLQIDGTTLAANVGDGGTTGEQTLNTGTHSVGETAGTATSLGNYSSSIECRSNNGTGSVVASGSGAGPLNVNVTNGSDIVCVISNTRVTVGFDKANDQGDNAAVAPGETIHYTLTVTVNNGTATNVVVTDTLPAGLTYTTGSANPSTGFTVNGQNLKWTVASLAQGTHTFQYDATVNANATGILTNLGCVAADQNAALVCDQTTVRVPTLVIDKVANAETITISGPTNALVATPSVVTWTLTYTLTNGPVTNAVITDQVPAGFVFLDAANGGTFANGIVTWNLGTLSANGSVSFRTTVDPATISRVAPTVNTSVIDSSETAPDSGQDSVTVSVQPPPLAGTPTPAPVLPNTAAGTGIGGEPVTVPIELLVAFFLGSLGALALANVRASNRRR
jgi:fimbrial isopeptide formation D2 family protein